MIVGGNRHLVAQAWVLLRECAKTGRPLWAGQEGWTLSITRTTPTEAPSTQTEADIRADERRKCREQINSMIVKGPLPGNGSDLIAQRNGLILAANALQTDCDHQDGGCSVCAPVLAGLSAQEQQALMKLALRAISTAKTMGPV